MTYVRIDTPTQYIYFENDTDASYPAYHSDTHKIEVVHEIRSRYTLNTCYKCVRMTKKNNIPLDKTTCVWYNKSKR